MSKTAPIRTLAVIFVLRALRMLGNGALSVSLGLYLASRGLSSGEVGLLISIAMLGDAAMSLSLALVADRFGRRRTLAVGALLMVVASIGFVTVHSFFWLCILAAVAIFSPNGKEVGPFLPVEHAALSEGIEGQARTTMLAWYNLVGFSFSGLGALAVGVCLYVARVSGYPQSAGYLWVVIGYGIIAIALMALSLSLPKSVERNHEGVAPRFGLHKSKAIVIRLSSLFAVDAFGGGFVIQSLLALWLYSKFGLHPESIAGLFFFTELLGGASGLVAAKLAKRFGLVNTMVFTHIPSSVFLILAAVVPWAWLAVLFLLLRASIASMDVPTRQAYTLAVVEPDERSAAGGVTNIARSIGSSLSPGISGALLGTAAFASFPLIIAGVLKIGYDLALLRMFQSVKPEHERAG